MPSLLKRAQTSIKQVTLENFLDKRDDILSFSSFNCLIESLAAKLNAIVTQLAVCRYRSQNKAPHSLGGSQGIPLGSGAVRKYTPWLWAWPGGDIAHLPGTSAV